MNLTFSRQLFLDQISQYIPLEVDNSNLRLSAVMLLICQIDGEDKLIFQSRSNYVRHHKGEISLPGGAKDPDDINLKETALRETQEEIGIDPEMIHVVGQLDDTETWTGYLIRPYIGLVPTSADIIFSLAEKEVVEILEIPIDYLLSDKAKGWKMVNNQGLSSVEEGYVWGEHIIWGATARIIRQFINMYKDEN
ncbi:MAG: hypothetical protein CL792_06185 [Chloroflexi bacterium]|nr:hypothetical protein [Chloroflexota bacterium]|tara:strand:+ start:3648 stop:4229 length:582 start_codon:yes stop_codon:yes gene_type:complete